jgi:tetratricopeptide (TPR) repeat protein
MIVVGFLLLCLLVPSRGLEAQQQAVPPPVAPRPLSLKVQRELSKAVGAMHENNVDLAHKHLDAAYRFAPANPEVNYLLGLLADRQGNAASARASWEKTITLDPNHTLALLGLATLLARGGDFPGAEAHLQRVLKRDPNSRRAHQLLSILEHSRSENSARPAGANLADLPYLKPDLPRWLPENVDDSVPAIEAGVSCPAQEILDGAADHVQEFTKSVDRITATEVLNHQVVDEWGFPIREIKRSFEYLVAISEVRKGALSVQEYRNGAQDLSVFPDAIATKGLPATVLVFHPYYRDDYDFVCEGLGQWQGGLAWQIHFAQKQGVSSRIRSYSAGFGRPSTLIALKGRAWVDKDTLQVVRMESDLQAPLPQIKLLAEHMDIQFGPVRFRNQKEPIWLPMAADIYFDLRGRRIRRRNEFRNYLLFSVEDRQSISAPKEAEASEDSTAPTPRPPQP